MSLYPFFLEKNGVKIRKVGNKKNNYDYWRRCFRRKTKWLKYFMLKKTQFTENLPLIISNAERTRWLNLFLNTIFTPDQKVMEVNFLIA